MRDLCFYNNYSLVGDLMVVILCITLFIVIGKSFIKNKYNFLLFKTTAILIITCAVSSIVMHLNFDLALSNERFVVYILKDINYISSFMILINFILYLKSLIKSNVSKNINKLLLISFILFSTFTLLVPVTQLKVNEVVFTFAYIVYSLILICMLFKYKNSLSRQMYTCFTQIFIFSLLIMIVQGITRTTSLTTVTFLLPLLAILFLIYSNPYDMSTGALDKDSFSIKFEDYIKYDKDNIVLISFYILNFNEKLGNTNLASKLFRFYDKYIKQGVLFRVSESRIVLVFKKSENKSYNESILDMFSYMSSLQFDFDMDYKITVLNSFNNILQSKEYIDLVWFVESTQKINTYYFITEDDINKFRNEKFIEEELKEIVNSGNLNDDRIVVMCQPIYDVPSGKFKTAEALMRFESHKLGVVYPDIFIPIAERINCIHFLSLIIFNKVCQTVKQLEKEGYQLDRISVNFSITELQSNKFCSDIINIVKMNNIPFNKVAIELTETMNDSDYEYMSARIASLRDLGMYFYLDDFGTGYSNFDRILKLPVDIIKFDRSLLLLSSQDSSYKSLIENFVSIFKTLNYSVLFEGVEDDEAENYCRYARADYLQGYKYSKPIPIADLRKFLTN